MCLTFYETAKAIKLLAKNIDQYVIITAGVRRGSIAKIITVEHKNFSVHNYKLWIKGCRIFWMPGHSIQYISDYAGETQLINDSVPSLHKDFMDRDITVGSLLYFYQICRAETGTNLPVLILAVVRQHKLNNTVWVQPIKIDQKVVCDITIKLIRLTKPERSMIIDKKTVETLMLYRLSN